MTPDQAKVALSPFQGEEHAAVKMAAQQILKDMGWDSDFAQRDEEELQATDQSQNARLLYVISALRLLAVLAAPAASFEDALKQANLAMQYLKHAENTGLKALQFGKTQADASLARAVAALREQMDSLAAAKARTLDKRNPVLLEARPVPRRT